MDYKVEVKPTYWHVTLASGEYSDYEETHLVFAGNDEFEVWDFLKRYADSVNEESEYLWGSTDAPLAMKWNDEKFLSDKYTGDKEDINWSNSYRTVYVTIERLSVIYFKR